MRTHHCRQCATCVLKMDHHCQWVLNCIGFENYKFFLNLLIYAIISLFLILLSFSRCVGDVAFNPYIDSFTIYIILLNYVLVLVLCTVLTLFTLFHFYLVLSGKTTIEFCEKKNIKKDGNQICYDIGKYNNFIAVFNRNPLLWFFPFSPNKEGNGLFEEFLLKEEAI
jgi:hypothetical protein